MDERIDAHFAPARALSGRVLAPPDKSISHRAALLGAFGEGSTRISRYLDSADTRSSLAAVEALGATVRSEPVGDGAIEVEIEGFGLRGASPPAGGAIDVGNAGTLIRLLTGLLAGQEGRSFVLDGDQSIRSRPMGRIAEPLLAMGASSRPLRAVGRRYRSRAGRCGRSTTRCRSPRPRSSRACSSPGSSPRAGRRSASPPRRAITASGCCGPRARTSGSNVSGRACRAIRWRARSASGRRSGSHCRPWQFPATSPRRRSISSPV